MVISNKKQATCVIALRTRTCQNKKPRPDNKAGEHIVLKHLCEAYSGDKLHVLCTEVVWVKTSFLKYK